MSDKRFTSEDRDQSLDALDTMLRKWHEENRASAEEGRERLLARLHQDHRSRETASGNGEDGGSPFNFNTFRGIIMHRYTKLAASITILAMIVAVLFPPQSSHHAAMAGQIVMLPDGGGRMDAFDEKGNAIGPCPLKHTDVDVQISGHFSRVTVNQVYQNPYDRKIEALYTFPLSHRGAVDRMTMTIGDRVVEGEVKERERARQIYEVARDQGYIAGLLEQERPNIFTQSVANIEPGATIEITISYVEILESVDGEYQFSFPIVVAPRYIPGQPTGAMSSGEASGNFAPDTDQVPDASKITPKPVKPEKRAGHDISVTVTLDTGGPGLLVINSPQHEVSKHVLAESEAGKPRRVSIALAAEREIPNRDFLLSWKQTGETINEAIFTHTSGNDRHGDFAGGFFTLVLQPPDRVKEEDVRPREIIFVLDNSGSMLGPRAQLGGGHSALSAAKKVITQAIDTMRPNDRFNVISFNHTLDVLWDQPQPNTEDNRKRAQQYVDQRQGGGGTEMRNAVLKALERPEPREPRDDESWLRPKQLLNLPPDGRKVRAAFQTDDLFSGGPTGHYVKIDGGHRLYLEIDSAHLRGFMSKGEIVGAMGTWTTDDGRRVLKVRETKSLGMASMVNDIPVLRARDLVEHPVNWQKIAVLLKRDDIKVDHFGRAFVVAGNDERLIRGTFDELLHKIYPIGSDRRPLRDRHGRAQLPEEVVLIGRVIHEYGRDVFNVSRALMRDAIEAGLDESGEVDMINLPIEDEPDEVDPMRIVLFVTDGLVGNDEAIVRAIRENADRTRVFTIGMSRSPNRSLLGEMARAGRGAVDYVLPDDDVKPIVERFAQRIATPVLTDISLEFSNELRVKDVLPGLDRLPDLFDVQPLVIHGRYDPAQTASGTLTIRGRTGAGAYERVIDLDLPAEQPDHDVIATLWARSMVDERRRERDRDGIIALGEAFQIMSEHTSFVAVEKTRITVGGKPMLVRVPIEFPKDMSWEGIFGSRDLPPQGVRTDDELENVVSQLREVHAQMRVRSATHVDAEEVAFESSLQFDANRALLALPPQHDAGVERDVRRERAMPYRGHGRPDLPSPEMRPGRPPAGLPGGTGPDDTLFGLPGVDPSPDRFVELTEEERREQVRDLIMEFIVTDAWKDFGGVQLDLEYRDGRWHVVVLEDSDEARAAAAQARAFINRYEPIFTHGGDADPKRHGFVVGHQIEDHDAAAAPGETVVRVYDLSPIITQAQRTGAAAHHDEAIDQLIEMITNKIDPYSWTFVGGATGRITAIDHWLFVAHKAEVQQHIQRMLDTRVEGKGK